MKKQPEVRRQSVLSRLLGLAAVVLTLTVAGLFVWYPYWQSTLVIREIDELGGIGYTRIIQPQWLTPLAGELHWKLFERIVLVDFISADLDDDDLRILEGQNELRVLFLYGPGITDRGVERLKRLPALESLQLVHCPNVSQEMEQELIAHRPSLNVERRGAAQLGVGATSDRSGCHVGFVQRGTAADAGGIRAGDVIVSFAGRPTPNFETLVEQIAAHKPGDDVIVEIERDGKRRDVRVELKGWRNR